MNWLHHLWFGYFWPSLQGNGPEALVQTIVYGLIAYLVVPPFRHWVNGRFHSVHQKLDDQHHEHIDLLKSQHKKSESEAERRHQEALALARRHHDEHMAALATKAPVAKKVPATKKATARSSR